MNFLNLNFFDSIFLHQHINHKLAERLVLAGIATQFISGIVDWQSEFFLGAGLNVGTIVWLIAGYIALKSDGRFMIKALFFPVLAFLFLLEGFYYQFATGSFFYYLPLVLCVYLLHFDDPKKINISQLVLPVLGVLCLAYVITSMGLMLSGFLVSVNLMLSSIMVYVVLSGFKRNHTKTQKRMYKKVAFSRALIETNNTAICLINKDYSIIDYNSHFERLFKLTIHKHQLLVRKKSVFAVFSGDISVYKWIKRFKSVLTGREESYEEFELINGENVKLQIQLAPIVVNNEVCAIAIHAQQVSLAKFGDLVSE